MQFKADKGTYIVVINKGESVVATLTEFCKNQSIKNASFSGLGAVSELECGYYALDEKKYYFKTYHEMLEVVSLSGNVMLKDGEPFVHAHGVFTDTTNNAFGGHIREMTVGVTLEITLTVHDLSLDRRLNDAIGLYLINCGGG